MTPATSCNQAAVPYRRGLHFVAIATAFAVFPLILVGAGVTSKDAGMAYPNGFTSDGYVLLNPPGWWDRDDTRWEHGHRLVGRTVGALAIVLAVWCWRFGGAVRVLGLCNLLAIVMQGLVGAFRVSEVSTTLAMIHGVTGQLCFCLACCVALVTGRTWLQDAPAREVPEARFLQRLCLAGGIAAFVQLVSGATLRHYGSDIALFLHVFGAIAVTLLVGWIAMWVMAEPPGRRLSAWLGLTMAVLMVTQLLLGGYAFTVTVMGGHRSSFEEWIVPSAHVGVGALLFASLVLATLITRRTLRPGVEVKGMAATAPLATT